MTAGGTEETKRPLLVSAMDGPSREDVEKYTAKNCAG